MRQDEDVEKGPQSTHGVFDYGDIASAGANDDGFLLGEAFQCRLYGVNRRHSAEARVNRNDVNRNAGCERENTATKWEDTGSIILAKVENRETVRNNLKVTIKLHRDSKTIEQLTFSRGRDLRMVITPFLERGVGSAITLKK